MPELGAVIAERLTALQAQKAELMNRLVRVDVAIEELTYLQKQVLGEVAPVSRDPAGPVVPMSPQASDAALSSGVVLSPKTHTPVTSPVDQLKAKRGRT